MSLRNFSRELSGKRVEGELVYSAFYSFLTLSLLFIVLYYLKLRQLAEFNIIMASMLILSILSYSLIIPTIRQVRAYGNHGHAEGMMVGMTLGMIAGFMPGFFVGATNGMFVGSVFGLLTGIVLGVIAGRCCGVMGVLEGTMAGVMGGLMGAMTAVMTINDNLIALAVLIFLAISFIIISLWYMIYLSTINKERVLKENYCNDVLIASVLFLLTVAVMVLGPRSFFF